MRLRLACLFLLATAFALPGRAQTSGVILIKNATLVTVTHGRIEHGSILIRGGKNPAVGTNGGAPAPAAGT